MMVVRDLLFTMRELVAMTGYDVKRALFEEAIAVRTAGDWKLAGFLESLGDTIDMQAKILGASVSDRVWQDVLANALEFEKSWQDAAIIIEASVFVDRLFRRT